MADCVRRRGKRKNVQFRGMFVWIIDTMFMWIIDAFFLTIMHFITNGYKRFLKTNLQKTFLLCKNYQKYQSQMVHDLLKAFSFNSLICLISLQYGIWHIIWLGWNIFIICLYLNVGALSVQVGIG